MRDRTNEIRMFEDTMQILKQSWYEKNGRRIPLKLTAEQMQEIQAQIDTILETYLGGNRVCCK